MLLLKIACAQKCLLIRWFLSNKFFSTVLLEDWQENVLFASSWTRRLSQQGEAACHGLSLSAWVGARSRAAGLGFPSRSPGEPSLGSWEGNSTASVFSDQCMTAVSWLVGEASSMNSSRYGEQGWGEDGRGRGRGQICPQWGTGMPCFSLMTRACGISARDPSTVAVASVQASLSAPFSPLLLLPLARRGKAFGFLPARKRED